MPLSAAVNTECICPRASARLSVRVCVSRAVAASPCNGPCEAPRARCLFAPSPSPTALPRDLWDLQIIPEVFSPSAPPPTPAPNLRFLSRRLGSHRGAPSSPAARGRVDPAHKGPGPNPSPAGRGSRGLFGESRAMKSAASARGGLRW